MKPATLFLAFFLSASFSIAQESILDSLINQVAVYTNEDTLRVKLLVNTSYNSQWANPEEGLVYAEKALALSNKIEWTKGSAAALRQIGNSHYKMSNLIKAVDYYHKALRISQGIHYQGFEASVYNNLGNVHADLEEYDKALKYYSEFLNAARKIKNQTSEIIALLNIGTVYTEMGGLNDGIKFMEEALALAEEIDNTTFASAIVNNLAINYKKSEMYDKAIEMYQKSVQLADEVDNKNVKATALDGIAQIYLKQEKYQNAETASLESLRLAEEINSLSWQTLFWQTLSNIYEAQNETSKALDAYKKHIALNDSMLSEENKVELTRKEMQFELEKQEAVAQAELKSERFKRNVAIGAGLMLVLAVLIGYFLYKRRRDTFQQKQQADFKTKVAETELKALRSQLNPHFIFNSLNSINDYIGKHDTETAKNYLVKFAGLMRSILEGSEQKNITLEEDIELMENYLQIESMRLNGKFTCSISVDKDIDIENTLVPPLILQPFIENSIWHGIAQKEGNGEINIEIKKEGDMIFCVVEDDGVGRSGAMSLNKNDEKGHSLGSKISENRIEIINSLKGTKGTIKLLDKAQGLRVEVKLPLELAF